MQFLNPNNPTQHIHFVFKYSVTGEIVDPLTLISCFHFRIMLLLLLLLLLFLYYVRQETYAMIIVTYMLCVFCKSLFLTTWPKNRQTSSTTILFFLLIRLQNAGQRARLTSTPTICSHVLNLLFSKNFSEGLNIKLN